MNERWVCKRCFADNDEPAPACARCGLIRGAESTDADRAGWAATTGSPTVATADPGWKRYLRFWWVPALAVALLVGYLTTARRDSLGALETSGTVSVEDMRAGDCFNSDEEEISEVDGVPCSEAHEYEVFAVGTYGSDNAAFPSDAEMEAVFGSVCEAPFEAYVGASYESSAIYASMITPSEETWADGDREFICTLYEPDPDDFDANVVLTESLRGAGR